MMLATGFAMMLNGLFLMLRLSSGGSFPRPLTAAEERECLERMYNGDMEARNKLVEHNLRLVAHIIKKYYTQTNDQDDLISIGTIGLIKGISTFNNKKGARLATYAARCIENEILMYFRSKRRQSVEVSLSDTIETDKDGNNLYLMDIISVDDDMMENLNTAQLKTFLHKCVGECLETREAEIIALRYGLNGQIPKTQRETADICGISRSYVSRIEKKALEKLRSAFEGSNSE